MLNERAQAAHDPHDYRNGRRGFPLAFAKIKSR